MIAFDLQCSQGHCFEGWFEDGKSYDKQKRKGLISCPSCDDKEVSKVPSAFSIKSTQRISAMPAENADLEKLGRKIADYVEKNFDDVGSEFTTEALKIHYGVNEPRNIRGVSSKEEEKTLKKEGVEYFKLPMPVDTKTDS